MPAYYLYYKGYEVRFQTMVTENVDGWLCKLVPHSSLIAFVLLSVEREEVLFR